MTEIEKMQRYIELTGLDKLPSKTRQSYSTNRAETRVLEELTATDNAFYAIFMAFEYGRAKGYRMAKAVGKG